MPERQKRGSCVRGREWWGDAGMRKPRFVPFQEFRRRFGVYTRKWRFRVHISRMNSEFV